MNKEEFDKGNVFGLGEPNEAYAKYFTGNSYLKQLAKTENECIRIYGIFEGQKQSDDIPEVGQYEICVPKS